MLPWIPVPSCQTHVPHTRLNSDLLSIWAGATMGWPHPNQLSPCWGPTSGQPDCESWSRAYNYSALSTPFNLSIMFHYVSVILSALASMSDVCRGEALIRWLKQSRSVCPWDLWGQDSETTFKTIALQRDYVDPCVCLKERLQMLQWQRLHWSLIKWVDELTSENMVSLCFCVWMLAGCGSKQDKTTTWQHIQWLKKCRKQWKDIKGFRLQSRSWFNGLLVWVEVHKCRWRTGNSCIQWPCEHIWRTL